MISTHDFKRAMAHLAGAVTVITTSDEHGQIWGFTATAFCSLSLEPPLVLCCLDQAADCYQAFIQGRAFAVNMLSEQQRHLAQRFATKGMEKYRATTFVSGKMGLPLLPDALVTLECSSTHIHAGGDHSIIVGLVEYEQMAPSTLPVHPLLYYAQSYGTFTGSAVIDARLTIDIQNGR